MEKFTEMSGLANMNSARANLHKVLNLVLRSGCGVEVGENGEGEGEGARGGKEGEEKVTPKKRGRPGRKVSKEDGEDGETPAKRKKATVRDKEVGKAEEEEGGEEGAKGEDGDGEGE